MEDGGDVRLKTRLEPARGGTRYVVVRVRDDGRGVPEDVRSRIFEPFVTSKPGGTGLGLCIAAGIMARHGGRLTVEASSDKGTTVAVWIPADGVKRNGQDPSR
jgi:signal transduction histidine kinase